MIPLNICFSQNMKAKIQGLGQDVRVAFESIENSIKAQDEKIEQLYKENAELKIYDDIRKKMMFSSSKSMQEYFTHILERKEYLQKENAWLKNILSKSLGCMDENNNLTTGRCYSCKNGTGECESGGCVQCENWEWKYKIQAEQALKGYAKLVESEDKNNE